MTPRPQLDARCWPFRVQSLHGNLGAEVLGVDLSTNITSELFSCIYGAFLKHQLLLFRDQQLPPSAHVTFARLFGEVQIHVMNQYHASGHPELYFLSNLGADARPSGVHPDQGTLAWHTDGSWRRRTGQATILYAEIVPASGGETHFCDMYAAWDSLAPQQMHELAPLRAVHNLNFSRNRRHGHEPMTREQRDAAPPVDHPIVRSHPETKRRCIFLGDHAEFVENMDYEAGRALIERVNAQAIHPSRVYEHQWQPGELVVWDNRCLLHRATAFDTANDVRVMRRSTVLGDVPA